jgi:predicted AlkP superfamily pyrophosphatase or phosphodiesterase
MRITRLCRFRLAALGTWLLVFSATPPGLDSAPPARHLVIISIDGLLPQRYTSAGPARIPAIRSLMQRGTWADGVQGVLPSSTYPSHTTLITGVPPRDHGIVDNGEFDPEGRGRNAWMDFAGAIKVPTLVGVATGAGLRTAVVQWPVSVGMRADAIVPRFFLDGHPRSLSMIRALSTPHLLESFEAARGKTLEWPLGDADKVELTSWLLRTQQPHLLLVHLVENDSYHHSRGPDSSEALAATERADQQVGRILDAIREAGMWDRTYVAVVSDHGFLPITTIMQFNKVLADAGLLTLSGDPALRQAPVKNWRAYFWGSGGTGFIYLQDPSDARSRRQVAELLRRIAADPANGIERVFTQEEIRRLGGPPDAVFAVSMRAGFYAGGGADVLLKPSDTKGGHGYDPSKPAMNAAFVLAGPGIPAGKSLGLVRMTQIAPTFARLLGVGLSPLADKPIETLLLRPTSN